MGRMAKAQFHKNQKVWVETVGTWATIDRVVPVWAKGFDEPVKITYDVGLGRDFLAHELEPERNLGDDAIEGSTWRLMRAKNKWQQPEDCSHHPFPGSYPVLVTEKTDWGGWRVPGAEYDRDPYKIEYQARLLVTAPKLLRLAQDLADSVKDADGDAPPEMKRLAEMAAELIDTVKDPDAPPQPMQGNEAPAVQAAE
jgi:hypothetical protein